MAIYRINQSIAAGAEFRPDLRPNDRFGFRGGNVRVRSVVASPGVTGDILETLFVGNELIGNRNPVSAERAAGAGVDNFVPAIEDQGLQGEVVDLRFLNTNAAARTVVAVVEIQNN